MLVAFRLPTIDRLMMFKLKGFTLFEMLIALALLSLLMMALFQGLDVISRYQQSPSQMSLQNAQLIKFKRQFLQDIINIQPRPHTSDLGQPMPALVVEKGSDLTFVRGGLPSWINLYPGGMQLLRYHFESDNLYKSSWTSLDIAAGEKPITYTVLSDLAKFKIELIGRDGASSVFWPLTDGWRRDASAKAAYWTELPFLYKVTLQFKGANEVTLLFPGVSQ